MKQVELKIIILGALGVGKTSLLHQYIHQQFHEDYRSTLGASVLSKNITVDRSAVKLQIWDTGGQERFRAVVSSFYKGADGCVLVFDVTDRDSFLELEGWRQDILEKSHPPDPSLPFVVLGNKIDMEERQVTRSEALSWCEDRHIPCLEVSAKNNINVEQAFQTLAKHALIKYKEGLMSCMTDSIKLKPDKVVKKKKKCCS
ncbi:ras-related protein Rab-7b-like isoform X2 [Lepisosteus oculatus]|uniref:ras-related protein Rab-7b isoform X2 n=1 Tax=Lepisosteus oculatus TaxID=7918 RepID=UPI0035F50E18